MAEKSAYERLVDTLHGWQQATSPWNFISPTDVAGMLPGGGIPQAAAPFQQGTQKTTAARQAFAEGRYGDAVSNYASGFLDTANAGMQAVPDVGPLMTLGGKLAMAIGPGVKDIGALRRHLDDTFPNVQKWVSENPNAVTVNQVVVPPEMRGQGVGTNLMKDVLEYADNVGKPVALTPDSSFGGNKSQLERWYRSLGFVPNKGRSKDYGISETMVRPKK